MDGESSKEKAKKQEEDPVQSGECMADSLIIERYLLNDFYICRTGLYNDLFMHQNTFTFRSVRWFSQWSRKAYAVFASIGSVVHIASLKCGTLEKAFQKTQYCSSTGMYFSGEELVNNSGEKEEYQTGVDSCFPINEQLLVLLLCIKPTIPFTKGLLQKRFLLLSNTEACILRIYSWNTGFFFFKGINYE